MDIILATILFLLLFRFIMTTDDGLFHRVLLIGFGIRLLLLLFTCVDIFNVPDAHGDADGFHDIALAHPGFFDEGEYHATNYTRLLSVLYLLTDDSRWFAQFINVVLSVMTLIYIRRILCILNVKEKLAERVLIIAALMPFLNIYSVVLLREAWVTFFVVLSLYFFVRWYLKKGNGGVDILLCLSAILLAMWMHAGAIGFLFGYFVAFVTYYRDEDKIRISKSTYIALFFLALFVFVLILNINTLMSKFAVEDFGEYAETKRSGEGGESDYLKWLDLSSPSKMLLFLPLKVVYFLYSPIVTDWRGLNDIAAFVLDSSVYIVISWIILTRKVEVQRYRLLKRYLMISLIATTVMFSFGSSNAGTAIRHRAKICSLFLVIYSISSYKKTKDKEEFLNAEVIS